MPCHCQVNQLHELRRDGHSTFYVTCTVLSFIRYTTRPCSCAFCLSIACENTEWLFGMSTPHHYSSVWNTQWHNVCTHAGPSSNMASSSAHWSEWYRCLGLAFWPRIWRHALRRRRRLSAHPESLFPLSIPLTFEGRTDCLRGLSLPSSLLLLRVHMYCRPSDRASDDRRLTQQLSNYKCGRPKVAP